MCTPTRAALMTGRYPFRYGMTAETIGAIAPWGISLNETFFPTLLQRAGYTTFMAGKWHLGFFKPDYLPSHRGFNDSSGILNAKADHYLHTIDDGYDWHVNGTTDKTVVGRYSGELVRDNTVAFLHRAATAQPRRPWFAYVAFQEVHSPMQVDQAYLDLYPNLSLPMRTLAGMVTHTDDMVADIFRHLNSTGQLVNICVFFSTDNGGPGTEVAETGPRRFDPVVIERNWPFRGQKHEIFEGGVRSPAFVWSDLLPPAMGDYTGLIHITDLMPTILGLAGVGPELEAQGQLDGTDQWPCLLGAKECRPRTEVVLNIDLVCDGRTAKESDYDTECPAPKAAIISMVDGARIKLMLECWNASVRAATGRRLLFNLSADPSESADLINNSAVEELVGTLTARLDHFASFASATFRNAPPWQGSSYFCASCTPGRPVREAVPVGWPKTLSNTTWEPWCFTGADVACPNPPPPPN